MLALAPASVPPPSPMALPAVHPAAGARREKRVAILTGCAQPVLEPGINEATIRLLTRLGVEVVVPRGEVCCGSLVHHMGARGGSARQLPAATSMPGCARSKNGGLDAIVVTASGCGTTIKDYGFMLRLDPAYAEKAARVSALAKDITEYLATLDLPEPSAKPRPDGRLSFGLLHAARPEDQHVSRRSCWRKQALPCVNRAKGICAAVRPAPTTSCSRRFRRSCATAR